MRWKTDTVTDYTVTAYASLIGKAIRVGSRLTQAEQVRQYGVNWS